MKFLFAFLLLIASAYASAQAACSVTGPEGFNGPPTAALNVQCGSQVTPPPPPPPTCTPPSVLDPTTNTCKVPVVSTCDVSQLSSSIGGKYLKRQCWAGVDVLPGPIASIGGDVYDLAKLLGGPWPTYNYSGYSPTFQIDAGKYIALQFTPTSSGAIQFSANMSYGDGGTISVSTQPGSLTYGSPGVVCALSRGASNGIYISTAGGVCTVKIGTTYYLNLADVDTFGNNLCYNGKPNTCFSSTVSYTIYTAGQ